MNPLQQTISMTVAIGLLLSTTASALDHNAADPRATGAIMLQFSPDGESLAYSNQGAIWRMDRSGKNARRLTRSDARFDRNPVWSHDGSRIAFVRAPSFFGGNLCLIDATTGDAVPLSKDMAVQRTISFDQLDQRILGYFQPTGERARFAWFNLTTCVLTDAVAAESVPAGIDFMSRTPVYGLSHDDQTIAYVSTRDVPGEQTGNQGPQNDVWRISLNGDTPERIVTWPARIHEVCWSGDDQSLIFSTERGGVHTDLWELPLADAERSARKLTFAQADEASPHVSADDRWLCYTDNRFGSTMAVVRDRVSESERIAVPDGLDFAAPTGSLSIRVVDGDAPADVTARVVVQHQDGKYHAPPGSLYRMRGQDLHFYLHNATTFHLPAGEYSIRANRGPEYKTTTESITVRPGEEAKVELQLERWTNQRAEGWISGESHIHANYGYGHWYNSPATMQLQCSGEDLMIANLMVANSDGDGVFDREYFLGRPDPHSTDHSILYWNEEYRSTIWGHMTLLNLRQLVPPIFAGFKHTSSPWDIPMNADIVDHVHDQDGFVNYTHPAQSVQDPYAGAYTAKEMPVDVALGKIDSMDVMGNQQANLPVWYRLLNCGFHLPASAGTDCFLNRIPSTLPGAVRVYVHCPDGFSYQSWIDNHRLGRTFVTQGPVLRFTVDGQESGATIPLKEPGSVRITADATAENGVYSLELVINGESQILATADPDDVRQQLKVEKEVLLDKSCWLALRVNGQPGVAQNQPFAHSSPVYVTVSDAPLRSAKDAEYFIAWIQRLRDDVRTRNQIPPRRIADVDDQLGRALEYYRAQVDGIENQPSKK